MDALDHEPLDTPLRGIIGERKWRQLEKLNDAGFFLLGDTRTLCPRTAGYPPMGGLPGQIDQARAVLGDAMVYRRRQVTRIEVPRADVEVDIDVENDENGVYLWGTLVTSRPGLGDIEQGYRPFCDWHLLDPQSEAGLFARFWDWFSGLRTTVTSAGFTFRAYCYNEAHENTQMRRCATSLGLLDEVEDFIASGQWVDLLKVFRAHLITGNPVKLKVTAPLSGFSWDVDEPAGDESMVRHDQAVEGSQIARAWLLTYNRNDVEATLALRNWLQEKAGTFPPIENLEAA
jgi:predicted RecB family nuclease